MKTKTIPFDLETEKTMTDEQIKQNAEEYANHKLDWSRKRHSESPYLAWKDGFEDGAHSRDEEIEQLGKSYHDMFVELAYKVEQLRKPWISVEERLPEKINKFMSEPVLCRYTRGSKEYFHVSQYDFDFDEWQISNVTHWMPIPELLKGGEI